jgi:hypothetical protein
MKHDYPCQRGLSRSGTNMRAGVRDPLDLPQTDLICGTLKQAHRGIYGIFMLHEMDEPTLDLMEHVLCDCNCPFRNSEDKQEMPPDYVITSDLELRRRK